MKRKRLKHVAQIVAGQAPIGDAVSDNGVIPFLQGCAEFGIKNPKAKHYCDKATKWAPTGSWLISVRAPVGEINKANRKYAIGRGLAAIVPRKIDENYLGFALLHSRTALDRVTTGSTYDAVSGADIGNLEIPVPSEAIQKIIADFLDRETSRIDQLIEKKERLRDIIDQRKQRIIDELSTTGIFRDAPTRKSGFDWLGDIPNHWQIQKLAWFVFAKKGFDAQRYTKEFCAENSGHYPVYSGQTINEGVMGKIDTYDYDFGEQGVLFSTTVGAKAMTIAHLKGKFSLSQNCMIIVPISQQWPIRYYYYQLQPLFRKERELIPDHMQASFRVEDLYRYWIAVPPLDEAHIIADEIDRRITALGPLNQKINQSVQRLREFRSSLITAAVTGQIDVTTWSRRDSTDRRLDQIEEEMSA